MLQALAAFVRPEPFAEALWKAALLLPRYPLLECGTMEDVLATVHLCTQ